MGKHPFHPGNEKCKEMKYIVNSWLLLPGLIFFCIIFADRPNVPVYDSYDAILGTVLDFKTLHGWDCFWALFKQHGDSEHRILLSRLFYIAYYEITGGINFTVISFIGDLQLVGIALGGLYFIRRATEKYWLGIGLFWMMFVFDLNTYNCTVVQMESVANYGVYFLLIAGLMCFDKGWVWMGAILQALTIFSNGNGMISAVLVALFVFNGSEWYKMKFAALPLLLIPFYFIGLHPRPRVMDLGKSLTYFICNTGAPFSFDYALLWGLLILGLIACYFPWKTFWKHHTLFPLLCIMAFSLISMALEAIFRGAEPGAQYQAGRYLFYPQLLIPITILLVIQKTKRVKAVFTIAIPVLLIAWCLNCEFSKNMLAIEANRARDRPFYYPPDNIPNAQKIAKEACEIGIYCIDDNR